MPDEAGFFSCLKTFFLGQEACKDYSISEDEFVFVRENVEHSDFSIIFLQGLFLTNFVVVPNPCWNLR